MQEESFKVIIYNSKTQSSVQVKIKARNYFDCKQICDTMYGGEGITLTII